MFISHLLQTKHKKMSAFGMIQTIKTNRAMQRSGQMFRGFRFYSSYDSDYNNLAISDPIKMGQMREKVKEGMVNARRNRLVRLGIDVIAIVCMTYILLHI